MKKENLIQICCKCYWNDQCCNGCNKKQEYCDDFTPVFDDEVEYLNYIEEIEYSNDLKERFEYYQELVNEMEGNA